MRIHARDVQSMRNGAATNKRRYFSMQKYLLPVPMRACVLILHRVCFSHAIKRLANNASLPVRYDAREAPLVEWIGYSEVDATGKHIFIIPAFQ